MPPEELLTALHQQPLVPFRLHLTNGRHFDVPHPDMMLLLARAVLVGILPKGNVNGHALPERSETIALIHIDSIEPRQQSAHPV